MRRDEERAILHGAGKAFFEAMLAGYAGGEKGGGIVRIENGGGYKIIEFTSQNYKVVDRYCTTPHSKYSAGTTTILFESAPVWWMSYAGLYPETLIPFLKTALKKAYEVEEFNGGRGPRILRDEESSLTYINVSTGGFHRFQGREEIHDRRTGLTLGFHEYFGMGLIEFAQPFAAGCTVANGEGRGCLIYG